MRCEKRYYVYVLASKNRVLYVGVTGSLMARILQHKSGECEGFTQRHKVNHLVYYEVFQYVNNAIARETEIKKWRREKKVHCSRQTIRHGKILPQIGASLRS